MIDMGPHLILNVKTKSVYGLTDVSHITNVMEGLSKIANMTLVYPPIVARFPYANTELSQFAKKLRNEGVIADALDDLEEYCASKDKKMTGISGIAVWLESHASIHTWPENLAFSLDAYSCKPFSVHDVINYISTMFNIERYNRTLINRYIGIDNTVNVISSE